MSRRETATRHLPDVSVTRRQALRGVVGGGLTLGAAKAVDNVLVGYGTVVGTNLVEQAASGALGSLAGARFRPRRGVRFGLGGDSLTLRDGAVTVRSNQDHVARRPLAELDGEWAGSVGLAAPLAGLAADLGAIAREEHTFAFHRLDAFVERVRDAEARPLAVDAVRRWPAADPAIVGEFTDADPADPPALIRGLVGGFREHTYYDAPRYVAGSIQDNVLFGAVDLRAPFRDPVSFPALLEDGKTGLFCYEFTHRSLEALHAVPAVEQTLPVVAARVWDKRHKHVYTAVGSVVREDGDLVVPMTFVDYTHTTLYHDARLTGLLGEGLEAFNERHRASVVHWQR
ncbi:MAG: hypothetical protein ABEJ92_06995 [Halobacteriales archaeon]